MYELQFFYIVGEPLLTSSPIDRNVMLLNILLDKKMIITFSENNTSLVDSVFLKMEEELAIRVSSVSISLDNPGAVTGCFSISEIGGLDCSHTRDVRVFDKNGNFVGAKLEGGRIHIDLASITEKNFYTIICAEKNLPSGSPSGCTSLSEGDFELGTRVASEL